MSGSKIQTKRKEIEADCKTFLSLLEWASDSEILNDIQLKTPSLGNRYILILSTTFNLQMFDIIYNTCYITPSKLQLPNQKGFKTHDNFT